MKIYKTFGIGILSLIIGGGFSLSRASTPGFMKVQGFLSDKSGGSPVPATGIFSMTFDLYDAQTLGALVAMAGPILVTVTNGLYEAPVPFPFTAFQTGSVRWLEITVELETLAPRVQIGSVPYAHQAELLDGLESEMLWV